MESNSQSSKCSDCGRAKAPLSCGICVQALCKSCAEFLSEDQFSFLPEKTEAISHNVYCRSCFTKDVEPRLSEYNENLAQAKEILVFMKDQGKETRLIKRLEDPVTVIDCEDEKECLLRLAFLAVLRGKNAIVDTEITSKKVRTGSYQTSHFSGSAIPANVSEDKLIKDRSLWHNPN